MNSEQLLANASEDANREWLRQEQRLREQWISQGEIAPEEATRALRTARRFFVAGYLVGWTRGMSQAA